MRWTQMFIPTLREDPSQVESLSQRLLIRAGFIRQLTAGVYSILPLGQRVRLKVIDIIRQEMNGIGSQEFALSALQPIELWHESGRAASVADIMFKLKDRKGAELALGLTHEEVFTSIARSHLLSYRQVPQMWYQIQTKFRDEPRPRGGLLRTREFTMKDSYSFDLTEDGLDRSFNLHRDAYCRIFSRCGLDFKAVDASSGAMGGSSSVEFMLLTSAGEDHLVLCNTCDYSANLEKASSKIAEEKHSESDDALEELATPGIRTIRELENFDGGAPAARQIKTLVFVADERVVLALLRGDQELNESKLQTALQASVLRQANEADIVAALGAHPGSLGACGVESGDSAGIFKIIADHRLNGRSDMQTGANRDDVHLRNVPVAKRLGKIERAIKAALHGLSERQPRSLHGPQVDNLRRRQSTLEDVSEQCIVVGAHAGANRVGITPVLRLLVTRARIHQDQSLLTGSERGRHLIAHADRVAEDQPRAGFRIGRGRQRSGSPGAAIEPLVGRFFRLDNGSR